MSDNQSQPSAPPPPIGFVEHNHLQTHPQPTVDQFSGPPPPYPWADSQAPKQTNSPNSPPPQYQAPPPSAYQGLPSQNYPSTGGFVGHHQHYHSAPLPTPIMNVAVHQVPMGNCSHCRVGNVIDQSDMCCIVCLIVLTILTFPFGLFFLCCLPCAVEKRCSNCHRLQ